MTTQIKLLAFLVVLVGIATTPQLSAAQDMQADHPPSPKTGARNQTPATGAHIVRYSAGIGDPTRNDFGPGPLHIIYSHGTEIVVPNEQGAFAVNDRVVPQESFSDIRVAEDHQTIGWLANYMMCAQSYACPLQLVIFRSGHILEKLDPSLGIFWSWSFLNGGKQAAACSGLPHGDVSGTCELYDTTTGRKLAEYDSRNGEPAPSWVRKIPD